MKHKVKRGSGILFHISSLPSPFGIGDLGPEAYQFADFLAASGQRYWQVLPLTPTDNALGNSPYSSHSAFAMNTLFLNLDFMIEEGLLIENDLSPLPDFSADKADYFTVGLYKNILFDKAYGNLKKTKPAFKKDLERFCVENSDWLDDFTLFVTLKEKFSGKVWSDWPQEFQERNPKALQEARSELADSIARAKLLQYIFAKQWSNLKTYCRKKGIEFIGDAPIYVDYDSADVWAHPELFKLGENRKPTVVAGVPPDYFSKTGQRWGNPVYRWDKLQETGFVWWLKRLRHNFKIFDWVRIDHFRGLIAYWEISASEPTAIHGQWISVPYEDFFKTLLKEFPKNMLIAEDLGLITDDVKAAMKRFGFPGMKVLQFAFGGDPKDNPYIPENFDENALVYTGTHDNNTTRGWFENDITPEEKKNLFDYLKKNVPADDIAWQLICVAMASKAATAIIPLQDILNLGKEARMNMPGTAKDNWQWRLQPETIKETLIKKLFTVTQLSKRI